MSEFRYDPVKRTWVILASQRVSRPFDYNSLSHVTGDPKNCPFCPGNESMTPPEVYSRRSPGTLPDGPGWQVRVVPNKFPALKGVEPGDKLDLPFDGSIHSRFQAFGVHEIVIETPMRNRQMVDMDPDELSTVLTVFRDRMHTHYSDSRFKTVFLFKNHGKEAGASLVHSHTQIMALPVIPNNVDTQLQSFELYKEKKGRCLMCEIAEREIEQGKRVVLDREGYLVLAPFAAASPFQLNIVPRDHSHDFSGSGDGTLRSLATVLGETLRCLRNALGHHPWNLVLYNAPANLERERDTTVYHWYLEITPRLTNQAGFEIGSGFSINTVAPEECAEILRAQEVF